MTQLIQIKIRLVGRFLDRSKARENRAVLAHGRRKFYDLQQAHASLVASEALQRVAAPGFESRRRSAVGRRCHAGVFAFRSSSQPNTFLVRRKGGFA